MVMPRVQDVPLGRYGVEIPDDRQPALLRPRHEWPGSRRADEKRDEVAALEAHSITSSASNCIALGTESPKSFAVLRLMMNSNLVERCTGRSVGFSPLRIRPT